jgi:hypothetical protein
MKATIRNHAMPLLPNLDHQYPAFFFWTDMNEFGQRHNARLQSCGDPPATVHTRPIPSRCLPVNHHVTWKRPGNSGSEMLTDEEGLWVLTIEEHIGRIGNGSLCQQITSFYINVFVASETGTNGIDYRGVVILLLFSFFCARLNWIRYPNGALCYFAKTPLGQ